MPVRVACPSCRRRLRVPEDLAGRRVTCPRCNHALDVPPPEEAPAEEPVSAPSPEAEPEALPLPLPTRLGVVALGLGLASVLVLCLPVVGYVSPVLSGAGLMLGTCGLMCALWGGA